MQKRDFLLEDIYVIVTLGSTLIKRTFGGALRGIYSKPSSEVVQDLITRPSSAISQHVPGLSTDKQHLFSYIVELFEIFCCVYTPIQTQFISSNSRGAGFHFTFALFSCADIPAGIAGGKVIGLCLLSLRKGNKGQFPVVQDKKKH